MDSSKDKQETRQITQALEGNTGAFLQLVTGTILDERYQVQDVIGIGGMGSVYRARDLHFPNVIKLVAVKEMINQAPDPVIRQTIVQNFEREANILVTLNHPSIPKIYDFFTQGEKSYLVEEFINGRDLEAILKSSPDPIREDQVILWAIELCDVLEFLHTHKPEPIIFRDIKPSNIMINQQNHPVLVDFGIAKLFEAGRKNTMVGTQGYSPPDQYRGEATPKVDIYALGATLHHLLTLRDPRLEAPFSFNERPIKEINPNVSNDLIAVIDRALQYDPEDRFGSADEMKEALVNVARKTGTFLNSSVFTTSSKAPVRSGVKPLWTFACEDEIRGTPLFHAGTIYVGCYDNNLYALDAANGNFRWKYASDGGIPGRPAIFEDVIYFGSEDNRLHAISSVNGKVSWTYYTEGPVRSSPRISQGHAFFGSDDGYVHAVNSSTGRMAWKSEAGSAVRSTPYVSDEYIYVGTEGGEMLCLDYRGGTRWRFSAKRAITSSPTVHQNLVFFGSLDGNFYALDAQSGWVIWRFRLNRGSISSPVVSDGLLYTGAIDHVIYCLDSRSSKEQWRYTTDHQVTGSPIIYKENLYCGSVDGSLYCLERKSGNLRWKFSTGGPITGTPAAYEDVIYIGSTDKNIYALLA